MARSSIPVAGYGAVKNHFSPSRRRIYILPTSAGLLFALTLLVMLLGAINYDNSLAYALTFLIGSLMPVTILHTWRNLAGLKPAVATPQPVFAGQPLAFPITLDNRGRPQRLAIELRRLDGSWRDRINGTADLGVSLPADALQSLTLPVDTQQRGEVPLGRVRVASSYPLGLFRVWTDFPCDITGLVYPKPAGPLPLPAPAQYQGEDEVGQQAGSDDFIGFRNYHPGDSIRSIDWKAVARGQELLIKRFSGSGSRQLDIDWTATALLGGVETRLSQLCRWVLEAERRGMRYRLRLPGCELPLDHGPGHQQACLQALARYPG